MIESPAKGRRDRHDPVINGQAQAARAQLESLYLVTARVSRLSLVEFLR